MRCSENATAVTEQLRSMAIASDSVVAVLVRPVPSGGIVTSSASVGALIGSEGSDVLHDPVPEPDHQSITPQAKASRTISCHMDCLRISFGKIGFGLTGL